MLVNKLRPGGRWTFVKRPDTNRQLLFALVQAPHPPCTPVLSKPPIVTALQLPATHMLVVVMEEKLVKVLLSDDPGVHGVPSLTEPQAIGGPQVPCLWQKRVQGTRVEGG